MAWWGFCFFDQGRCLIIDVMHSQSLAKTISLFLWFPILILFTGPLYAIDTRILQNKEVIVLFEEPLRKAAEEAAGIYPVIKSQLEKTLTWRINFRPTILLIKDSKTFQGIAGSDPIVAFAIPQRGLMVIDYSKMKTHPFTIEVTLKHELCHLLLHHHIKRKNLPRWLDEGIAQWVCGGIAEIIVDQRHSKLDKAILTGKRIRIRALAEGFPRDKDALMLAYEESKSLVEYMITTFGTDRILMILNSLRDGDDMDAAVSKSLSISFGELERRWHHHLNKKITWIVYFIHHLYEILFFLAGLILIYGFIRGLRKKRRYMNEDEDVISTPNSF